MYRFATKFSERAFKLSLSFAIFLPQFVLSGLNQYLDLVFNFNRGISIDVAMFNGSVAFVIGTFLSIILFFFLSQVVTGVIQLAIYLRYDQPELGFFSQLKWPLRSCVHIWVNTFGYSYH